MSREKDISNCTSSVLGVKSSEILVSDKIVIFYNWVVYSGLCQSIVFFGVATNIINIICFIKQGFKDPINVSLLGLTIADLGSLTTIIFTILCMNPGFGALDLPFQPLEFQYVVTAMAHSTFTHICGWITALITLERCMCITAPLKVKNIITTSRVTFVVVAVYVLIISAGSPFYVVNRLDLKFYPEINRTLIGLIYLNDHDRVENISYMINNTCLPFIAFAVIIVSTIVLTIKLNNITKWRNKSVTTDNVSSRNQRVAKMVVLISVVFIICFVPICLIFLVMSFNSDFSITGKYKDILFMIGVFGIVLESVNSSVNIFIYYNMSSKYRDAFKDVFFVGITPSPSLVSGTN